MKLLKFIFLLLFLQTEIFSQNKCISLDGTNDSIYIPVTLTLDSFTIEMWVNPLSNCPSGGPNGHFLELGSENVYYCNGNLYLNNLLLGALSSSMWSHVAFVVDNSNISYYNDCNLISSLNFNFTTSLNRIIIGKGTQKFGGKVDELKVFTNAKTQLDLCASKNCVCKGDEPDLTVYFDFDNTCGTNLICDIATFNGINNGTLFNFSGSFILNANNSNLFTPNYYSAEIKTYSYSYPFTEIQSICSGDPISFNLTLNNSSTSILPMPPLSGVFEWQEYDLTNGWVQTFIGNTTSSYFTIPSNVLIASCTNNNIGYEDKIYRVKVTIGNGSTSCTYFSRNDTLRVYCPIEPIQWNVIISQNLLCEDSRPIISASITSLVPSSTDVVWKDGNGTIVGVGASIFYIANPPLPSPQLCIKAIITNGNCDVVSRDTCWTVDPIPICGTISAITANDPDITLVGTNKYGICPGKDAVLQSSGFSNGIIQWEYSFDLITWSALGSSNPIQNTNTLAQTLPPYNWPPGTSCISYRIKNKPLSNPSACSPCYSDTIKICLYPQISTPILSGPARICNGSFATIFISNYNSSLTYQWYNNGILIPNVSSSITTNQAGCYQVIATGKCTSVKSQTKCIEVCKPTAIITCIMKCKNQAAMLSACSSFDQCSNPQLTFAWSASNNGPGIASGCNFTHTPAPFGTQYSVTVTDASNCTGTTSIFVMPCQN